MSTIDTLGELFRKFPGIGPRQAKRFVYFLLTQDSRFRAELAQNIQALADEVNMCTSCQRFFVSNGNKGNLCKICLDKNRDVDKLMLVEKDVDLDNVEHSGAYSGYYFVLGGSIPILEKQPDRRIRLKELLKHIEERSKSGTLKEIIYALSNNPDGDNTARFLNEQLIPLSEQYGFKISTLGRGLSTGSELEYSDTDTIKNAFDNRH